MGSKTDLNGYFEGTDFVRVEPHKFKLGEIVSYYGCCKIERIEETKYRWSGDPRIPFRDSEDSPYYHVVNLDTGDRNQEFNGTLKKDKLGTLIYG